MDWKLALQLAGIALGLLYLYLEYKADIRLWIVGIIMPVVHGTLYFRSGLYADAAMQGYYIAAGIYGLCVWLRASRSTHTSHSTHSTRRQAVAITRTPTKVWLRLAALYIVLHAALYGVLTAFTDSSVPVLDSFTTALCIVAYWMLSRKYVEQWLVWFTVDAVTVGLYLYKGIPLTACLYGLYTCLAIIGYIRWRRLMQATGR